MISAFFEFTVRDHRREDGEEKRFVISHRLLASIKVWPALRSLLSIRAHKMPSPTKGQCFDCHPHSATIVCATSNVPQQRLFLLLLILLR